MKRKVRSVVALLAILTLIVTLVPLANTKVAMAASSLDTLGVPSVSSPTAAALEGYDIPDMAVASDGNTIYVIADGKVYKSIDGGCTFEECPMPAGFGYPAVNIAVAPDNPDVVAVSDSSPEEAVWVNTHGCHVTWAQLPLLNSIAANMRIMDLKVGPARAGTIYGRDYLVATADESAGVALGSLQIIGETVGWTNIVAPGTADFTSCEFSPNFVGDCVVLAVGSTPAATFLYTYSVQNYSTMVPSLVHAAVQLNGVTVDFGAAANGILVSDIALPADYELTPGFERAYVSFASNAAAPNNGGVYRCDGIIAPVELEMAGTQIHSIAYAGTIASGKLLAGSHASNMVWHTTNPASISPTWNAATTPPTGSGDVVVCMHAGVSTNHICYAGTSGGDSGFFISPDNAYTFDCVCDACLYSGMGGMEMLVSPNTWDINDPDAGTWAPINTIDPAVADASAWGDRFPDLPWSCMYVNGANWVYGNIPWNSPVSDNHQCYRLPFTVPINGNCVEVHFKAFVDDRASFYIDGPGYSGPTLFYTVPALSGTPTEFSIDADNVTGPDCLQPGDYTIYIDHWDIFKAIYGLIFTAKCVPCECLGQYVYSAKFLCGKGSYSRGVMPAHYATAINIHNFLEEEVYLRKKVVVAYREDEPVGEVSPYTWLSLGPNKAVEVDCIDICGLLGPLPVFFVKGFVVIESTKPLNIVAVYTAKSGWWWGEVSIDVEQISPVVSP